MNTNLNKLDHPTGWFAIACSHEITTRHKKSGLFMSQSYELSRNKDLKIIKKGLNNPVIERNNLVFAWSSLDMTTKKPSFHIPTLDNSAWSQPINKFLTAHTYAQDIYENCIDIKHFSSIHRYKNIKIIEKPNFRGENMRVSYAIKRKHFLPLLSKIAPQFEVCLFGLGCAINHIFVPKLNIFVRMLVCATPSKPSQVDIRLLINFKKTNFLFRKIIFKNIIKDFCQDIQIWNHKTYLKRPLLIRGDGPVAEFRQWCEKFYRQEYL